MPKPLSRNMVLELPQDGHIGKFSIIHSDCNELVLARWLGDHWTGQFLMNWESYITRTPLLNFCLIENELKWMHKLKKSLKRKRYVLILYDLQTTVGYSCASRAILIVTVYILFRKRNVKANWCWKETRFQQKHIVLVIIFETWLISKNSELRLIHIISKEILFVRWIW